MFSTFHGYGNPRLRRQLRQDAHKLAICKAAGRSLDENAYVQADAKEVNAER